MKHALTLVWNSVNDKDGDPIGPQNLHSSRCWIMKLNSMNGSVDALQANLIAEIMFSQMDHEVHTVRTDMLYQKTTASFLVKGDWNTPLRWCKAGM
jgi:hypothetical protein